MRKIKEIKAIEDYNLFVRFENGDEKIFDFKPLLNFPVFEILSDKNEFSKVVNRKSFIEWPQFEIDLSADTLWHEGNAVTVGVTS